MTLNNTIADASDTLNLSELDKINTRRVTQHIQKSIAEILLPFVDSINSPANMEAVKDAALRYLDDVRTRRAIRQYELGEAFTYQSHILIKDDRSIPKMSHEHIVSFVYTNGKNSQRVIKGLSWRNAKRKFARLLAIEKNKLTMEMSIQPVATISYIDLTFVASASESV